MNYLIFVPLILLIIPFIPAFIEYLKRKDRGPREIPEQTTYEETPDLKDLPKSTESKPEISRLERARGNARLKAVGDIMRITGDISIPDGAEINNHLMVHGNLKVGKKVHIYGSVKAFGDIELGESTIVEGHVLSEGEVKIGKNCRVKGIVDSLKDITLGENAVVEAVSTEKTVKVGPNAKINRRILSGSSIITLPREMTVEKLAKAEKAKLEPEQSKSEAFEVKEEISKSASEMPTTIKEETLKHAEPAPPVSKEEIAEEEILFEELDPEVGHLYLYAPTRYGKTYLIQNYIIPRLMGKKRIIVIDSYGEYPFEPLNINYDKTIPMVGSDLFKAFISFNIWGDIEGLINGIIDHITKSEGNVSIRPNIVDAKVEKLIISEFLKRITQIRWKTPLLLIVEEADKYDVISALTRGRHANIQVILTSAKRLMPEVFSNAHLVLGSINPSLIRNYDPHVAKAVTKIRRHEFIWEKDYHDWRKFRLGWRSMSQPSPTSKIIKAKTEVAPAQTVKLKIEKPKEAIITPKVATKAVSTKDRIFKYLEERIKMLEENRGISIRAIDRSGLTPIEAKVLEAAQRCKSPEEICLRLLLDPVEVEEAINSLIGKGHLDRNLEPKEPSSKDLVKEPFDGAEDSTIKIGGEAQIIRDKEMDERTSALQDLKRSISTLLGGGKSKEE
ncbi:hypothetical protein J7L18_06645 [Candidatus Bathyarchaeota archaeon]|nr:hypothetical protein [Candidatus Bathyarchaeota archaeon]